MKFNHCWLFKHVLTGRKRLSIEHSVLCAGMNEHHYTHQTFSSIVRQFLWSNHFFCLKISMHVLACNICSQWLSFTVHDMKRISKLIAPGWWSYYSKYVKDLAWYLVQFLWNCHQDIASDMSTFVQVMAWYHQATSQYLNQMWHDIAPLGHNKLYKSPSP